MELNIESNKIFAPLWRSVKRYILLVGGRSGGRSYEASQKIVGKAYQTKRHFRAAIMREVHTDIRHSIWQEIKDRVEGWNIAKGFQMADSTMELARGKNSIHAHGFRKSSSERTAKLKSLAGYTDAFIEEAEEVGEAEFQQLDDSLRTEGSQIHLLLNTPPKTHWMVKRWFNLVPSKEKSFYNLQLKPEAEKEVEFIFSTHSDNPYIVQDVHDRYESYKTRKPEYYWQMIKGLCPETILGKIYSGWKEIPKVPHEARLIGSWLDFGFDPDPVAYGNVYYYNGGYILDEKLYATEITNDELATTIKLTPSGVVVADSAEPKSIEELKRYRVNIIGCAKGADSVDYGIKHVQGIKISYTARSENLKKEYDNYAFKVDKDGNQLSIEDPKCANHHMSGIRYFFMEMIKVNADPEAQFRMQQKRDSIAKTTKERLTQTTR